MLVSVAPVSIKSTLLLTTEKFYMQFSQNSYQKIFMNINKAKCKVIPVFNWTPLHKYLSGNGGVVPPFLILETDGCEWSAPHPSHLIPSKRAPGYLSKDGWVVSTTGLDAVKQRKTSSSAKNLVLAVQTTAHLCTHCYPKFYLRF
jgi:hypothetical protein